MTMYNCFNCERYLHISKMGFIKIKLKIKRLLIDKEVPLCKWCMKRAGIKYSVDDVDYVVLKTLGEKEQ